MTPLLRRVYLLFAIFVVVYGGFLTVQRSTWYKERLYRVLLTGSEKEKASAGFDLAYLKGERQLLRALKAGSPEVRLVAANSLWELWLRAAGRDALRQVQSANRAAARKEYPVALRILDRVIRRYPRYAEGWNRRATLYWELGRFEEAITDAQKVVAMNPNHFGAWQGMGMCHARLGDLEEACHCIRKALKITPHDQHLRKFLDQCEEMIEWLKPGEKVPTDLI
jgi:tetratricopeptide (TPR) repeat protein